MSDLPFHLRLWLTLRRARTSPQAWIFIAIYVAVVVAFVTPAGVSLRQQTWDTTRSIHYEGDIENAFHWGSVVNAVAKRSAGDTAGPPTVWQLLRAEDQIYRDLLRNVPDENYELDYPPYRLLTVALWRRHVAIEFPGLNRWPGRWRVGRRRPDASRDATEDIAAPLLAMNTIAEGATALLAAALVVLWVWRSNVRRGRPRADGVLAFMVSAAALFYALRVVEQPNLAPPPAITILASPEPSSTVLQGDMTVTATINAQGARARWYVEWGTTAGHYDHTSPVASVNGYATLPVRVQLTGLPQDTPVHYRVVARNDDSAGNFEPGRGTTRTDDAVLLPGSVVQPAPPSGTFGSVWPSVPQWIGIGVLFVVLCWSLRQMDARHRAWATALVVAVLIWFDPTFLLDAHCYPQWDAWLLPPFLLAALLASLDCWLAAGLVMGIGVMLKGQFLIGGPVLLVWPLAGLRWGAATRLAVGFALMAGVLLGPWVVLGGRPLDAPGHPLAWIGGVLAAAAVAVAMSVPRGRARGWATAASAQARQWRQRRRRGNGTTPVTTVTQDALRASRLRLAGIATAVAVGVAAVLTLVLIAWPDAAPVSETWAVALAGVLLLVPRALPRRSLGVWAATVAAVVIWSTPWLFGGDWSWEKVGFEYGTKKFDNAAMGHGSNGNLPGILHQSFDWNLHNPMFTLRLPDLASLVYGGRTAERVPHWMSDLGLDGAAVTLDMKQAMAALFGVLLVCCGIAAAVHARRRDPRFLAALIAPWVLMPNLLCQMMSRYHIWGAVLSAILMAIRPELGMVYVLLTILAAGFIGCQLLDDDPARSPQLHELFVRAYPDSGWVMLMLAAVVLFLVVTPPFASDRRRTLGRRAL